MIIDGYTTPGRERETALDAEAMLRQMDAAGVERAVIAPEDRELVIDNARGNERMLSLARRYGERLIPACCATPWRSEAGDLVRAAVHQGAKMLVMAPALQGVMPNDELMDSLMQTAAGLRLPVYFHTGPHSMGGPTQVILLAEKHPNTRFVLGHCGTTDHAWDMPVITRKHALANVWFETSFIRPWGLPAYAEALGPGRMIYGSSAPRNDLAFEFGQHTHYLPPADHGDVYGPNLAKLLAEVNHAG